MLKISKHFLPFATVIFYLFPIQPQHSLCQHACETQARGKEYSKIERISTNRFSDLTIYNNTKSVKKNDTDFNKKSKINYNRLYISTGGLAILNIAAYQPFKDAWWEEERTHFHFYRGWRRTTGLWDFGWDDQLYGHMDKLGHYYCGRILSEQLTNISRWIGFEDNHSRWIGPVFSSLLMLEIEIYDGFFKDWGFSLADFAANELGAFAPLIAYKYPALKNFHVKLSYHPSNLPKSEPTFVKDYAGMTFWLAWNIHSALPTGWKNKYPPWLDIALGYSVAQQTHGDIELYLAPDINWEKIPIGNSEFALFFKRALNYLHFPCFAFKLTPDKKFYPVYF